MYGSQSTMRSPSTVSTMRKTPCVAGCCGPMLMCMSTVSSPSPPAAGCRVAIAGSGMVVIWVPYDSGPVEVDRHQGMALAERPLIDVVVEEQRLEVRVSGK